MTDPYTDIAHHLPNEVKVGGALITMVEPDEGFETAYNRWYEDDHFYSGAMAGPWFFSGRRFVATRELRAQRAEVVSPIAEPPEAGCYISLYWITAGQEDAAERWAYHAMADSLTSEGRGFAERRHIYTAFHRFQWAVSPSDEPLRPETSLAYPFSWLITEIVDAPDTQSLNALSQWLQSEAVAEAIGHAATGICLAFAPVPFSQGRIAGSGTASPVPEPDGIGHRLCLLWLLQDNPSLEFDRRLESLHTQMADRGELRFSGSFLPTVPGTNRYVDELR